jgi:AcrR family transcriptional regulator
MTSPSLTPERAPAAEAAEQPHPRPGRPRDPRADEAILQAVLDLAADEGLGAITLDAVAQRAGVGKATIYRRWTSKEAMLLDAWQAIVAPFEAPDTGSLRGDLTALLERYTTDTTERLVGRTLPQLIAAARVVPELQRTLSEFFHERREPFRIVLRHAAERGELRTDIDFETLHDLITGPPTVRLMVKGEQLSQREIDQLVDLTLRAITT